VPLASIFNMSLASSVFPTTWKTAQVTPIFKKGNRQVIANYRPISLLPLLSKVMEHAINKQLCEHLETSGLLHPSQHGFRRKRSTNTALLILSNRLFIAKNNGQITAMASLDYSRAFDTINHDLLLSKLAKCNISSSTVSWFKSYLSDRKQYVLYNGVASDTVLVTHGVPQGSILAPILFLIYINDMLSLFDEMQTIAYADDVTIIATDDTQAGALSRLQTLLDTAYVWSVTNQLYLNPAKCVFILFPVKHIKGTGSRSPIPLLHIGDSDIHHADSVKILGVTLSASLSWQKHVESVCGKLSRKLGILRRLGCSLDTRTRAHIYKAYIKPDLDYCLPIWGSHGTAQATLFNKLLCRAKRIITRNNSAELSNDDFNHFCLADFNNIVLLAIVCQFHQCLYAGFNLCDFTLLSDINKSMSTRGSDAMKCRVDKNRKCCNNSFRYSAPKLWNTLPNNVTCIPNFTTFYSSAVKHIFN
jgi:hypothetical protein